MPELVENEAPDGYKKDNSSSDSSPNTPITTSTLSSPASLSSPSPETSALFRMLSYGNRQNLVDMQAANFPREQNLFDLLAQSSGIDDLQELYRLREIRLRIMTSVISLSRLEVYTPNIRILRLDGSSITSLREIGTSLYQLRVLHVSKCGLTCLDGTFGLTGLVELHAADNDITDVGPCAILENIKVINLDRNPIVSLANVSLLSLCPKLAKLSIKASPVSKSTDYFRNMRIWMPYLKRLDGRSLNDADTPEIDEDDCSENKMQRSDSCSTEISSMTDAVSTDCEKSKSSDNVENIIIHRRPATAIGLPANRQSFTTQHENQRPCTAVHTKRTKHSESSSSSDNPEASSSLLTSGGIFCGNIARALSRARPARRPMKPSSIKPIDDWVIGPPGVQKKTEVTNAEQDHHSIVLKGARELMNEPLPEKPPETTPVIELEFGVTGSIRDTECESSVDFQQSSQSALKVSKKWRKAFRMYRQQRRIATFNANSLDSDDDDVT